MKNTSTRYISFKPRYFILKNCSICYCNFRLYLDTVHFESNWKERSHEEALQMVRNFMDNSSWVIDGNYCSFLQDERLKQADKIVFFDFPRRICFFQAYRRYKENRGKTRESISDGCMEKFDFEFAKWILFDGRAKKHRDNYKKILRTYKNKTFVLKSNKDTDSFLKSEVLNND